MATERSAIGRNTLEFMIASAPGRGAADLRLLGSGFPVNFGTQIQFDGDIRRDASGVTRPVYVNPTTSTRFNAFLPRIIRHFGLTAVAGKGGLDCEGVAAPRKAECVCLSMVGGAAALLSEGVAADEETGWDDLIEQFRLSRLRLDGFGPLTVAIDAHGNSLYHDLATQARARMPALLEQLVKERGT